MGDSKFSATVTGPNGESTTIQHNGETPLIIQNNASEDVQIAPCKGSIVITDGEPTCQTDLPNNKDREKRIIIRQ